MTVNILTLSWLFLSGSESNHWLGVLFTTKDDEQVARHLGLVFLGELCNLLLFDRLESHLDHADSAVHNLFLRGDNSLGLLFLEH